MEHELSKGGFLKRFLVALDSLTLVQKVLRSMEKLDHCIAGGNRLLRDLAKQAENWLLVMFTMFSSWYVEKLLGNGPHAYSFLSSCSRRFVAVLHPEENLFTSA